MSYALPGQFSIIPGVFSVLEELAAIIWADMKLTCQHTQLIDSRAFVYLHNIQVSLFLKNNVCVCVCVWGGGGVCVYVCACICVCV